MFQLLRNAQGYASLFITALFILFEKAIRIGLPILFAWLLSGIPLDGLQSQTTHLTAYMVTVGLLAYCVGRFLDSALAEWRQLATLPFRQRLFAEVTQIGLSKKISQRWNDGEAESSAADVAKISRAAWATDTLVDLGLFLFVPTIFELVIITVVIFVVIGPAVAVVLLVMMIVFFWVSIPLTARQRTLYQTKIAKDDQVRAQLGDILLNAESIRHDAAVQKEQQALDGSIKAFHDAWTAQQKQLSIGTLIQILIMSLGSAAIFMLVMQNTVYGPELIAQIVLVNLYLAQILSPVQSSGLMLAAITHAWVELKDFLPTAQQQAVATPQADDVNSLAAAEFGCSGLHLMTADGLTRVNNASLSLSAGTRCAIIGDSGSGKSSLLKMMAGQIVGDEGQVILNGRPLNREQRNTYIRYVPQSPRLFNRSIKANILYGADSKMDMLEVQKRYHKVIQLACLETLLGKLPKGDDSSVGEIGGRLSGGECQRIAIARALMADTPVLLLDEATSDLDPQTEDQILRNICDDSPYLMLLAVTHHTRVLKFFHQIARMTDGKLTLRASNET